MKEKLFKLLKDHAYRYSAEEFTLASGKKSNHYFNCKEITLYPDRLALLALYLVHGHIPSFLSSPPESVGGLTLGADPISYSVALEYAKSGKVVYPLVIRKETKDHGTKKEIEGAAHLVKSCLVIDDVITTGGSTIKAVEALRRAGLGVDKGICILDREEGGNEALTAIGITMFPIFKKSDFL
ncbi:MAG: orotate phosphoribosyltransferase [Leptospiraceae bacterium]|nr:orotate phosphoribosyltransferase [Leptospiraceae bacterium]